LLPQDNEGQEFNFYKKLKVNIKLFYMQENDFNYSQEIEKHLTTIAKQSGIVFTGKFIGYILGLLSNFVLA